MRTMKSLARLTMLGAALLALAGSKGIAQEFKGRFDLPVAAHWGKVALEPGTYKVVMTTQSAAPLIQLTNSEGKTVIVMAAVRDLAPATNDSHLTLENIDGSYFIRSLKAGDVGLVLTFKVPAGGNSELALARKPETRISITKVGK